MHLTMEKNSLPKGATFLTHSSHKFIQLKQHIINLSLIHSDETLSSCVSQ